MADRPPAGLHFTLEVDGPQDVAHDETRADALVTVRARPAAGAQEPSTAMTEVLVMDRSLSMAGHGKLDEAKRAMCAAIDALREGTYLGIVAGHHRAEVIFPADGVPVPVDAGTREAAKARVLGQLPEGGTAIGTWLALADRLFSAVSPPSAVRHAVLYTDGKDEHETPEQLEAALRSCADRFVCDARGLGEDWKYQELLRVSEALHGDVRAVVEIADLTEDFTALVRQARRIVVGRSYLGLRLNSRFELGFVRQTRPVRAELPDRQERGEEIHVPLGSWSADTVRQYQVSLRFTPESLEVGERLRAARITLHAEAADGDRRPCTETRNMVLRRRASSGIVIPRSADLTRIENEQELGMAMRACADARLRGDLFRADQELRIALDLAEELRDEARLGLLRAMSETGPDGRPRLRRDTTRGQMQRMGLESVRTTVPPDIRGEPPREDSPARDCPRCGTLSPATARFCEKCGHHFGSPPTSGRSTPVGRTPPDDSEEPRDKLTDEPRDKLTEEPRDRRTAEPDAQPEDKLEDERGDEQGDEPGGSS